MSILSHLDNNQKLLIERIITEYQMQLHYMEDCTEFYHGYPGIRFSNVFDDNYTVFTLSMYSDKLAIIVDSYKINPSFNNPNDNYNYSANNGVIIYAKFIQLLSFLKSLYDNGYIFFLDDDSKDKLYHIEGFDPTKDRTNSFWIINSEYLNTFVKQHFLSNIIPSPALISFANNGFRTEDQLRYEKQLLLSNNSLEEAKKSNIIAERSLLEAKASSESAKKGNYIAIIVAITTMIASITAAIIIPTSISHKSINEIGLEIKKSYCIPGDSIQKVRNVN